MGPNCESLWDWFLEQEYEEAKQRTRKEPDLIEELFSDLREPTLTAIADQPVDINRYFRDRLDTTKDRVDQIRKEMETRHEFNAKFLQQLDSQISYAALSLGKFANWGVGYNTGVDAKRNHLERLLEKLRSERRAAELGAWEDLVRLRKELREATIEYQGAARLKKSTIQDA